MKLRMAWFALVLAVVSGAIWAWNSHRRAVTWRPALVARQTAARTLAQHLARQYPGSKALVFGNPFSQRSGQPPEVYDFEKIEVQGVLEGFASRDSVRVVYPVLRPEFFQHPERVFVDPKTTTPLSFLVAPNSFEQLAQANPGYDLIISLVGVPVDFTSGRLWQSPGKPHLGLLLPDWRVLGGTELIREAFRSEKVAAAVITRPNAARSKNAIANPDDFDAQFLLVTKDNIEKLLQTFPREF